MSILNHGDICRYICGYLLLGDICMFRRCNKYLRTYISGNFFYDKKTMYLMDLEISPSEIMGFTTDINYQQYLINVFLLFDVLKDSYLTSVSYTDVKIARYLMKTQPDKLYGEDHSGHMYSKDHHLIDLSVKLSLPDQLGSLFKEIVKTKDKDLISWFESKYVGDQLEKLILENRFDYHCGSGGSNVMWDHYGSQYEHLFFSRQDDITRNRK